MSNKRIICWIGLLCILLSLLGLGIKISRARELSDYKAGLKKHVEECDGYSEEERQVLFIAIDHIRNPEIIIDDSLIFVYRSERRLFNGDSKCHKYFLQKINWI